MHKKLTLASLLATAFIATSAHAQGGLLSPNNAALLNPDTGNTSAASNWRFLPGQAFNGVAGALDGVARLSFSNANGNWACSGSLLAGGQYVLTAAHCADNFSSMTVQFGVAGGPALVTRTVAVGTARVNPLWNGTLDTGADIAVLKLNAPVTTIAGYHLSTTNDVGKNYLMAGYGTTQLATTNSATGWFDSSYGHFAYNTFDVLSKDYNAAMGTYRDDWGYNAADYAPGATYMSDFDRTSNPNNNTLQRVANSIGGTWTSSNGLGADEGLIAGGDSGGGDFVWNGTEWLLSGVHSWGWGGNSACGYAGVAGAACDNASKNGSSYGDLSGSTATFSHIGWVNSVTAVPEPESYAMLLAGLFITGVVARRRKAA